jgi:TatD DNase family protein
MIDSHAHLTCPELLPVVDAVLQRARAAGMQAVINICTDAASLKQGLLLAERYPWVYNVASGTPHDAHEPNQAAFFEEVAGAARSGKLVAIGETGLEYHHARETAPQQKEWFIRYLHLALELKLPVVIHCRDAFKDFFEIIDAEYSGFPGILHCFTGSMEEARGVIARGWCLSLSGIVTYKKSFDLQEVAKRVPLNQLLIETDAPWLAPQSRRGKPNEPAFLAETAAVIAGLKGLPVEELIAATAANAIKILNLKKGQ